MSELKSRSAREVLDDHLRISQQWSTDIEFHNSLEADLRRNVSEDIVILINRGVFRGHEGVRELAAALGRELPEHRAFNYTHVAVEDRIGLLEWAYEDAQVRVRDGVDSYVIEDGKIVLQTIHYTLEPVTPGLR